MIWQKEFECMNRKAMDSLQLERLKKIVDYCINNVPHYAKKLGEAGITAEKIKTLSDIKYIPFTTKADIRDNYPFGLFAKPMKEISRIHASSGTTGKPTVVGYTKKDLELWSDMVARIVIAAGARQDDIAQVSFGYGLFTGAFGLHYGLEHIGAAVIPMSSGNTEKQIMIMKDFGSTVLIATPSYALYMSEVAKEMGFKPGDLKLRLGLFGAEGCTDEMRKKIEENMGIIATDNYGMSEIMGPGVSGECYQRSGLHINEDHFLPEIINSETEEVLPKGETGELVITTLTKEGFPMLRYRTRDISSLDYTPCECGRTSVRMAKVRGRSDDMLIIKGVNVFPSQVESVLVSIPHIGPHYQLIVRTEGFLDTLEVLVELIDNSLLEKYSELERLNRDVKSRLKTVLGLEAKVKLVEPKTIERSMGKAKRVVDLRNK
jgi:phenylacetate-CoA ligase